MTDERAATIMNLSGVRTGKAFSTMHWSSRVLQAENASMHVSACHFQSLARSICSCYLFTKTRPGKTTVRVCHDISRSLTTVKHNLL